jgi:16S rRNA (uracil1498-N3)-methyltransferase
MSPQSGVTARFHAPDARVSGDRVRLPDEEARHLTRVLRLGRGDAVRVFNGAGGAFEAVVVEIGRSDVWVLLGAPCEAAPEPGVRITLAAAVLKGDRMDEVVRDAVMMGVAAIQPIVTARSEISLAALARSRRPDRWTRIAVASVKQCGRAILPPMLEPRRFGDLLLDIDESRLPSPAVLLVEPGAGIAARGLAEALGDPPREATLVVGPEGGWTSQELDQAVQTCRVVTLGGRTLRADAVPLVALASLYAVWGEF